MFGEPCSLSQARRSGHPVSRWPLLGVLPVCAGLSVGSVLYILEYVLTYAPLSQLSWKHGSLSPQYLLHLENSPISGHHQAEVPSVPRLSNPALPTQATCFGDKPSLCPQHLGCPRTQRTLPIRGPPPGLRGQKQAGNDLATWSQAPYRPAAVPSRRGSQGQQNCPINKSELFGNWNCLT